MKIRVDLDDYKLNHPKWISYDEFVAGSKAIVGDSWNGTNDFVPDIRRAGAIDIEVLPDDDKPNQAYYVRFTMPSYEDKESWLTICNELMQHVYWGTVYQESPEKIIVTLDCEE